MRLLSRIARAAAVLPVAPLAAAADAAPRAGEGSLAATVLQLIIGLILVLGLIAASAWMYRRAVRPVTVADGSLRVLTGLALGHRERLVLVQVGRQQLLVGVAPGVLRTLHVLDEPLTVETAAPVSGSQFAARLQQLLRERRT